MKLQQRDDIATKLYIEWLSTATGMDSSTEDQRKSLLTRAAYLAIEAADIIVSELEKSK